MGVMVGVGTAVDVAELVGGVGVTTGMGAAADEQAPATKRPMKIAAARRECDARIGCARCYVTTLMGRTESGRD